MGAVLLLASCTLVVGAAAVGVVVGVGGVSTVLRAVATLAASLPLLTGMLRDRLCGPGCGSCCSDVAVARAELVLGESVGAATALLECAVGDDWAGEGVRGGGADATVDRFPGWVGWV